MRSERSERPLQEGPGGPLHLSSCPLQPQNGQCQRHHSEMSDGKMCNVLAKKKDSNFLLKTWHCKDNLLNPPTASQSYLVQKDTCCLGSSAEATTEPKEGQMTTTKTLAKAVGRAFCGYLLSEGLVLCEELEE